MRNLVNFLVKTLHKFGINVWSSKILLVLLTLIILLFLLHLTWRGRIFPKVKLADIPVGSLSVQETQTKLISHAEEFLMRPVVLSFGGQVWNIDSQAINLNYNLNISTERALAFGRNGWFISIPSFINTLLSGVNLPLEFSFNEEVLSASLSAVATQIEIPSIPPSITVLDKPDPDGSRVKIEAGEAGRIMDVAAVRRDIDQHFSYLSSEELVVKTIQVHPAYASIDPILTKIRAEHLLDKKAVISYNDSSPKRAVPHWELSGEDLVGFLSFDGGFDKQKIASYSASLAESIDRAPVNALFIYQEGRVSEFAAARNGLQLSLEAASDELVKAFLRLEIGEEKETSVNLPVTIIPPAITTEDVNSLGIKELLGRGESTFHGSIANREHNIELASKRISGQLISPGEVYSFNAAVGEVSPATGYRQSYIIKDGRTILGDGGGVCQVSTTLFRTVLDAGLPVVERKAHSYRVSYYEQNSKPGFDATVFAPSVDFQFLNDSPAHILIQTQVDTKKNSLVVEIYGTSDGRIAKFTNHRIWDVTPPPPDLYQDDPSLPSGTVKQVDWKAWGAKVKFDYSVERNGETISNKTFYSNFRPWQSVFLRGTGEQVQ